MLISVFDWEENIAGIGETASCQQFLLYLQCFQKAPSKGFFLKLRIM